MDAVELPYRRHSLARMRDQARHIRPDYALPPGPSGVRQHLALLSIFNRSPLEFLETVHARYGDVSSFMLGMWRTYQISDPALIEAVLLRQSASFHKDEMLNELDRILGQGLLVSEGDHWRKHRKIAAPFLARRQIASYAETMVRLTGEQLDGWRGGEVVDLFDELTRLTLRIVVRTLFGMELPAVSADVGEAMEDTMGFFQQIMQTYWYFVPQWVPHPKRLAFERAVARLHEVIGDLIQRRRALPEGDDLLWRLITATYEDGSPIDDAQLRSEAITMFLAGHETTTLALLYAWNLLMAHPEVYGALREEIDGALGGREATVADLDALPLARAVVQETMRLYPPAWSIGREAAEPVRVGSWHIPERAQIFIPTYLVHRDPRWFDDPLSFRPERWLDGSTEGMPRFAYFPFGGGPRVCIGNHFAMMEVILVLTTMAQRFHMRRVSAEPLRVAPSVTLRPANTLMITPEVRA